MIHHNVFRVFSLRLNHSGPHPEVFDCSGSMRRAHVWTSSKKRMLAKMKRMGGLSFSFDL